MGNVTAMNGFGNLTYDAENRLLTASAPMPFTYSYSGDGHRVVKKGPNNMTVYVYDAMGQLAAEYDSTAQPSRCSTCYLSYDHLDNVRLVTDSCGSVISRHDYLPFGEELMAEQAGRSASFGFAGPDYVSQRFTGKERDSESGLDYFGARYYGSALGRFTSPDPLLNSAKPWNPQSWNRYAYALNNPLVIVDPTGLYNLINSCDSDDKKCNKQFQQHAKDLKTGLSNLQKQVDKMKDGPEKQRLQASLQALGTENDSNNVGVKFGALSGTASGHTDVSVDDTTGASRALP